MTSFALPDPGEGITEAKLVEWHVTPGEAVNEDEPVASVETDKAVVDIPMPADGTITSLAYDEGDTAIVGDELLTYDETTEASAAAADDAQSQEQQSQQPQKQQSSEPAGEDQAHPSDKTNDQPGVTTTGVKAMPRVKHRAREQSIDLTTINGSGPDGRILLDDLTQHQREQPSQQEQHEPLNTPEEPGAPDAEPAETDGSDGSQESDESNEPVATSEDDGVEDASDNTDDDDVAAPTEPDNTTDAADTSRTDHESMTSTPDEPDDQDSAPVVDHDGFERFEPEHHEFRGPPSKRAANSGATPDGGTDDADDPVEPPSPPGEQDASTALTGTRQAIADNMRSSLHNTAQTTLTEEADVTDLVAFHDDVKDEIDAPITYLSYFAKAASHALNEHPRLNATLTEDELTIHDEHNFGIAVDTERGLLVPVLDDADSKSVGDLANDIASLADTTRSGDASPELFNGSTFTISSIGSIAGEAFTPILNTPEVAILGIGQIKERPRYHDGELTPAHIVHLSLTIDHQAVDGADAARFLKTLKATLNKPKALVVNA